MNRTRNLLLPSFVLDRESSVPMHRQLSRQLAQAIHLGTHDGARLPSTRVLARLLGVSRNTVLTAYDELRADGRIQGRTGCATLVASGAGTPIFIPRRVLRDAQYPARTVGIVDPDGTPAYLTY